MQAKISRKAAGRSVLLSTAASLLIAGAGQAQGAPPAGQVPLAPVAVPQGPNGQTSVAQAAPGATDAGTTPVAPTGADAPLINPQRQANTGANTAAQDLAAEEPAAAPLGDSANTDIVVTGSRLALSGYQQPTPVTVVGAEKLQRDNRTDLASVLVELPSVGPSQSANSGLGTQSTSSATAGLALINLRSLGVARTLTLFDGVRVAPSIEGGGVDLNLLPSSLVQRIDVVTGGASAAWGSDAVSGVINIVLNKTLEGVIANAEAASNQDGTRQQLKGELSFGTKVGSSGHLILSGAYLYSPDRVLPTETSWYRAQNLVNNPAYTPTNDQPRLIHSDYVGIGNATQGGLITSGPLRGTQFIEGGRPVPFNFGNVSGTLSNGGTFANPVYNGQAQNLTVPIKSTELFGYFSWNFPSDIVGSIELNYGKSHTRNSAPSYTRNNNLPISVDNPYLDPGLAAQMRTLGLTSFNLSTTNTNNAIVANGDEPTDLGVGNWNTEVDRTLFRQVASLKGPLHLFADWDWTIDLQHSEVHRHTNFHGNPITSRYNAAVDAVRVTTANVGTSGLPVGSIACRSTLTAPTNGCLPLNVLGIGVADPAAILWVQGRSDGSGSNSDLYFKQYTASGAIRGEPFSTWAGPVKTALGVDYRRDAIRQTADPLQYARAYTASNRQFLDADQTSIEGYGEVNVPLVADSFVQSLDLNAAGRWTDYSTSGQVVTWKLGLVSQLNKDVRIRGTVSRDIRAPSLISLFDPGSSQQQVVTDPLNGNAPTSIVTLIAGNPNLKPEKARTYTAGIVLTPSWLPGFNASVDYYTISIRDAFATPTADQVLSGCADGNENYCALVQRSSANVLTGLLVGPVNAALEKTAGIDFQVDYRVSGLGGRFDFSVLGSYITELKIDSLGSVRRPLNSLNRSLEGPNRFRTTFTVNYSQPRFNLTSQVRLIGAGKLNTLWGPKNVDDNDVPAVAFVDLRGSYFLDEAKRFQAYVAIDNLLDRDPPIIPNDPTAAFAYFFVPTRTELYDFLGRSFRVGVRAKF